MTRARLVPCLSEQRHGVRSMSPEVCVQLPESAPIRYSWIAPVRTDRVGCCAVLVTLVSLIPCDSQDAAHERLSLQFPIQDSNFSQRLGILNEESHQTNIEVRLNSLIALKHSVLTSKKTLFINITKVSRQCCLLKESYETNKYILWAKFRIFNLRNHVGLTVALSFKALNSVIVRYLI